MIKGRGLPTDSHASVTTVSDVHHKILGLRTTVFTAEEAAQQDKLAVEQAVAFDSLRKAWTK